MKSNEHKDEVEIPIMRYALDIIKKWQFNFPILKYVTGKSGYNVKIRKLLDQIDREVKIFDKDSFDNIYNALYTMGSSKLCRKTHLDMLTKVQVSLTTKFAASHCVKGVINIIETIFIKNFHFSIYLVK